MRLVREGRGDREVIVEAGTWPTRLTVVSPDVGEIQIRLDSVKGAILKNLDSLRLGFTALGLDDTGQFSVELLRVPKAEDEPGQIGFVFRMQEHIFDTAAVIPNIFMASPEAAIPFEAFLVQSEATDSLKEDLKEVRKALTDVRRRELTRIRELQGAGQGSVEEWVRADELIQKLREEEEALLEESELLNSRIRRVSEEEMKRQWVEAQAQMEQNAQLAQRLQEESRVRYTEQREQAEQARAAYEEAAAYSGRRPLTHYIVGQSFVAGAQLTPLNPTLAEYFGVEEGLLVTEVVPGTPAEEAGILAGDVVVRVAGDPVTSLGDLRFGLGYLDRPLRIRVVRRGEPVEIVIRK
jgi:hypothetical protein